jgi:hypothetical protein
MSPTTAVCNYALLRFVPYPERGEGVNVGVLVACQEPCLLDFQFETEMPARVRAMFPNQDREMFTIKMDWMRQEVERVRGGITGPKRCQLAFVELIRQRDELLAACEDMVGHYVRLIESGDCGNWNPEEEPPVIECRRLIASVKGVADGADPMKLFQADRIHPREEAHPMMLDNVWPELKKLL